MNAHSALDAIVAGIDWLCLRGMMIKHQPIELQQVERVATVLPPGLDETDLRLVPLAGQPLGDGDQVAWAIGTCRCRRGKPEKMRPKDADPGNGETAAGTSQLRYAEQTLGRRPQPGVLVGAPVNEEHKTVRLSDEEPRESVRRVSHQAVGEVHDGGIVADKRRSSLERPQKVRDGWSGPRT